MEKGNRYVSKNWQVLILDVRRFRHHQYRNGRCGYHPADSRYFRGDGSASGLDCKRVRVYRCRLRTGHAPPVLRRKPADGDAAGIGTFYGKQCRLSPDGFFLHPACGTCASRLPASGRCSRWRLPSRDSRCGRKRHRKPSRALLVYRQGWCWECL